MSVLCRCALFANLAVGVAVSTAFAADIEPGLWRIESRTESGGVVGPPRLSSKCLTADQVKDVPQTFSPIPNTINSQCAPIERSFDGRSLTWRLACKGQIDIELDGDFTFDTPRHYTGAVRSRATMMGRTMVDSRETLEAQWLSACP